ncbi:MAG: hypothetical protein JNK58_11190, partial [Phycisphaerae bacterium]|nr:hypothetical protein [Phycisphaerae bacterium]
EVQSWVVDPGSNFGWLILGNESAPSTAKRFDSRENDDPAFRPVLTVTFIPAPAPFMVSATATMCWLRRRHR